MDKIAFYWCREKDALFEKAKAVRLAVFVQEQGYAAAGEFDEDDAVCQHLLACVNGGAVGTARVHFTKPGQLHMGRLALLATARGRGYGAAMMHEVHRQARNLGADYIVLNAQQDKAGFYEKLGYAKTGETSLAEGRPHVEMYRRI